MLSANISNKARKEIYRRDHYRCALCDGSTRLQIHHAIPRGQGGSDHEHNLITLCSFCHNHAHGFPQFKTDITQEDIELMIIQYLSDYYAGDWYPFK